MEKQWKQWQILFGGAPKSLQMVTAAMKLKDTYSLEEKLWPILTAYEKAETDTEAETPVLWPPDAKNWLIWKDPVAGKDWRQ